MEWLVPRGQNLEKLAAESAGCLELVIISHLILKAYLHRQSQGRNR